MRCVRSHPLTPREARQGFPHRLAAKLFKLWGRASVALFIASFLAFAMSGLVQLGAELHLQTNPPGDVDTSMYALSSYHEGVVLEHMWNFERPPSGWPSIGGYWGDSLEIKTWHASPRARPRLWSGPCLGFKYETESPRATSQPADPTVRAFERQRLCLPWWAVLIGAMGQPAVSLPLAMKRRTRRLRAERGQCDRCGYDL